MSQNGVWGSPQSAASWPPPTGQTPVAANSAWPQARPSWQPITQTSWQVGYGPTAYQTPGYYQQPHPFAQPPLTPSQPYGTTPYSVAQPYQTSPWTAQPTMPGARPPVKRPSWIPRVVFMVIILLVVAPVLASMLNQINQTLFPEPGRTTTGVPTYSPPPMSGNTGAPGRYTPGPPDLDPNEPPSPRTYDEIHEMLERNPLYAQALVPTDCTVTTIDLVHGSTSEIEEYMNQFIGCLMSAWYGPVVDAGFELPRPSVTVYTSEITSACGELPMYNAVYCTADQQIYYARDLIEALPNDLRNARFLAESIIAHEFGHTLQYRTMILMSEAIMEVDAASDSEKFDLSRRLEMQADCFAGLFLNSVTESTQLSADDEHNIIAAFTALGGTTPYDDDHGTGANRAYWTAQGLESTLPGICGTFLAPAHQVS